MYKRRRKNERKHTETSPRRYIMSEELKLTKTRECIHCEKFFDCNGKPKEVARCVNFVERKKQDGRA